MVSRCEECNSSLEIISLAAFARKRVPTPLKNLNSVVVAILDLDGSIIDANAGFYYVLHNNSSQHPDLVKSLFVSPSFDTLANTIPEAEDSHIFKGILNIGKPEVGVHSIIGSVYREHGHLLLVGEHDIAELNRLNALVLQLNEDMAQMHRDLSRKNRVLKRSEKRIHELMLIDTLTNIPNRHSFQVRMQQELARCVRYETPLSLAMVDIDFFKSINDRYGHDVGDEVLIKFAQVISETIRDSDYVARIGGEEFAIVLPETESETGLKFIERTREKVADTYYDVIEGAITASFGIVEHTHGDTLSSLMKKADIALYQAKAKGRNQVSIYSQKK